MIIDFQLFGAGGVLIFDAETGEPITRVCYVDDERGIYARYWCNENPDASDVEASWAFLNDKISVHRRPIRLEFGDEMLRAYYEAKSRELAEADAMLSKVAIKGLTAHLLIIRHEYMAKHGQTCPHVEEVAECEARPS